MILLVQIVPKKLLLLSPSINRGVWILYHFTVLQSPTTKSQIIPMFTTLYLLLINLNLICFNLFYSTKVFFTFLFPAIAMTPASFMSSISFIRMKYIFLSTLSIKTLTRTGKRLRRQLCSPLYHRCCRAKSLHFG